MDQNRILTIFFRLYVIAVCCLPVTVLSQGTPAIVDALKVGDIEAARSLVALGADVNVMLEV